MTAHWMDAGDARALFSDLATRLAMIYDLLLRRAEEAGTDRNVDEQESLET